MSSSVLCTFRRARRSAMSFSRAADSLSGLAGELLSGVVISPVQHLLSDSLRTFPTQAQERRREALTRGSAFPQPAAQSAGGSAAAAAGMLQTACKRREGFPAD